MWLPRRPADGWGTSDGGRGVRAAAWHMLSSLGFGKYGVLPVWLPRRPAAAPLASTGALRDYVCVCAHMVLWLYGCTCIGLGPADHGP